MVLARQQLLQKNELIYKIIQNKWTFLKIMREMSEASPD